MLGAPPGRVHVAVSGNIKSVVVPNTGGLRGMAAVDAGILGYQKYLEGQQFYSGDGIVTRGADNTVHNIGRLAREGMRQTDKSILEIMMNS